MANNKKGNMKKMSFTAIIEETPSGVYVGQVEEFPEAISQGNTIEELKTNLLDALQLVIDCQREETMNLYKGKKIIRRKLNVVE